MAAGVGWPCGTQLGLAWKELSCKNMIAHKPNKHICFLCQQSQQKKCLIVLISFNIFLSVLDCNFRSNYLVLQILTSIIVSS